MKTLFSKKNIQLGISDKNIQFLLIIALAVFCGLMLSYHKTWVVGFFAVILAFCVINLGPKYYIIFWLIFAGISNKIMISDYGITTYGAINLLFLPPLAFEVVRNYWKYRIKLPNFRPYLFFLCIVFASIWYSQTEYLTGIRKFSNFIIPPLFCILTINTIKNRNLLIWCIRLTLISTSIMGIVGTAMFYLGEWIVYVRIPRATGVLGWPNEWALFLSINLAVSFSLVIVLKEIKEKLFYGSLSVIFILSIIPTFSKSGYISSAVIFILIALLYFLKSRDVLPLFMIFLFLALIIAITIFFYSKIIFHRLGDSGSFEVRLIMWDSIFFKFLEHPILGNGFRSSNRIMEYYSAFPTLRGTHNLFFRFLLEIGLVGLIAFLWAYISMIIFALKVLFQTEKSYVTGLSIGFITAIIGSFIFSMTDNAFLQPMINLYAWFYFSFLICFHNLKTD